MKRRTKDIVHGASTLAVGALLLTVLYAGGELRDKAAGVDYPIKATFNKIDGLADGAEVRMGGIKIGVVGNQELDSDYRAVLTLKIESSVKLPLDTSAAIHTNGLFGSKYVVLEPGGDEEYMADNDEIDFTQDAVIVSELLDLIIAQGKANRRKAAEAAKGSE